MGVSDIECPIAAPWWPVLTASSYELNGRTVETIGVYTEHWETDRHGIKIPGEFDSFENQLRGNLVSIQDRRLLEPLGLETANMRSTHIFFYCFSGADLSGFFEYGAETQQFDCGTNTEFGKRL